MARKKQLDKLSLEMIQCEKDGFGVHYGRWKALQNPVKIEPPGLPEGWLICKQCGKPFKPTTRRKQFYCGAVCGNAATQAKHREKKLIQMKEYRERKKAEGKGGG